MIWFFCIRTVNFSGFIVCLSGWQSILGGLQTKICAVKAFDFKSKSLAPSVQPSVSHDKSAYLKQLSLVKEARAKHDIKLLTKRLKTIAIIFRGKVQLDDLLPIYENITATKRTSNADVCDLMWNTGRLGISGTKGKHRSACMNLLNLFLGAQNLTTTEVSNGLVAMTTLGLEFSKLSYDTRAKMQDIVTERLLNYVEDDGVSQIVCSLGKLGAKWDGLRSSTRQIVLQRLCKALPVMLPANVSVTLYGLGLMEPAYWQFDRTMQSIIVNTAASAMEGMSMRGVSTTLFGLGKMKVNWQRFPPAARSNITKCLFYTLPHMSVQGLQRAMWGMAQMDVQWKELPVVLSESLLVAMHSLLRSANAQHVSNLVYSLGKMHCQLSRLNETSQAHLLQILGRRAPAMDAKGVANTLYGLAGMQIFSWRELPAETQLNLDRALSATLLHMAPKDIDSTLYACNKISDFELSPEKASALLAASNRCAHQMGKQTLCNIIYSFGKLGIRWDRPILQASSSTASTPAPAPAPPLAPSNLTMAISKHAGRLSEHDLSNVLFGMSLSGMRWQNLSTPLQEALVDALTTGRSPTTPRGVSNNLYGLCKLEVSWSALSEGCKSRLQQEVTALLPVMDELSFANALYALAMLDASWADFSLEFKMAVAETIKRTSRRLRTQEMANIMYALAVLSFDEDTSIAFDTAPDEATHRDPAYLSRMLLWYICSRMVEAHSLLSEQPLAQRHRTQFDVFFQYMNSSVNGARLVQAVTRAGPVPVFYRPHTREGDPLKAALDNAKANSAPSGLHLQVVTHLVMYLQRLLDHARSTFSDESDTISAASSSSSSSSSVAINKHDFVCVNEFAGLALAFPVDVAVFRGGNLRALVEIDGDFHYTANGDGQRVLHRVDQLKEHLYRLRYPDVPFFRVRTDQVRYMGLEGACTELALKILKVSLLY